MADWGRTTLELIVQELQAPVRLDESFDRRVMVRVRRQYAERRPRGVAGWFAAAASLPRRPAYAAALVARDEWRARATGAESEGSAALASAEERARGLEDIQVHAEVAYKTSDPDEWFVVAGMDEVGEVLLRRLGEARGPVPRAHRRQQAEEHAGGRGVPLLQHHRRPREERHRPDEVGGLRAGGDHDRRVRGLIGLYHDPLAVGRRQGALSGEVPVLALAPIGRLARPDGEDMVDRFDQHGGAVGVEIAEDLGVRAQPARADAEHEAALEQMVDRLADDHDRARRIADDAAEVAPAPVDVAQVQTNIVYLEDVPAAGIVAALREEGVLAGAMDAATVRLVTHADVSAADCDRAADALRRVLSTAQLTAG